MPSRAWNSVGVGFQASARREEASHLNRMQQTADMALEHSFQTDDGYYSKYLGHLAFRG